MENKNEPRAGGTRLLKRLRKSTASVVEVLYRATGEERTLSSITLQGVEEEPPQGLKAVDWKNLKEAASLIKEMTALVRNLYGMPTESERLNYDINREKLRLAQEKGITGEQGGVVELQLSGCQQEDLQEITA